MQDIRDALDPIPLPEPSGIPWLMIAGGLLAALAIFAAIRIVRRRLARGPAGTPEQAALGRLAKLNATPTKAFYFELTAILVEYLDAQFPVGLVFCTSSEILSRLRSIETMTPESEGALRDLLAECDRAKFAPSIQDADPSGAARRCRRVIDLFAAHSANVRRIAVPDSKQESHAAV